MIARAFSAGFDWMYPVRVLAAAMVLWTFRRHYRHLDWSLSPVSMALGAGDVMVSWLPLYHDMGLILGLVAPICFGFPVVLMTPQHFVGRPSRWLKAIARHRGTVSGAQAAAG